MCNKGRTVCLAVLAAAAIGAGGCMRVASAFWDRDPVPAPVPQHATSWNPLKVIDLGLTTSTCPQASLDFCLLGILTIQAGSMNCTYFTGLRNGRFEWGAPLGTCRRAIGT